MKIINELIDNSLSDLELPKIGYSIEHPKDESHGDFSVNVAMQLAKRAGKNPRELAAKIVTQLTANGLQQTVIEKVEVAGPGFINFSLKNEFFFEELKKALKLDYGINQNLSGKKVMVEYTDPNPFKEIHIGHLMSNTIGESLACLQVASGAEVKRACYQGDVGLHVAKSIWGMQQKLKELSLNLAKLKSQSLNERQKFMGQAYAYGAGLYESDEKVKAEIHSLNKNIYTGLAGESGNDEVMELYHSGRSWSLEYFETIYQRLGTKFDEYFFESEAGPVGLMVVEEGLKKGVLEIGEEGAVVYKGEKNGMHTRVFRNKLGLPTYEAKDLGLAKTKWERYKYDSSLIVTANEITEYFKVVLKVMEQLYPELRAKTLHLPHGIMKLTTGKMSSRTGKVVTGEGLLDELKEVVLAKMGERDIKDRDNVADKVAVGALKYTVLKQAVGGDIIYDPEKMTNLEGSTGPFLQYTYARAKSILRKFNLKAESLKSLAVGQVGTEELAILRWLYRYPEVVEGAAKNFAPHMVAGYVYELSSRFNSFYQACRVEENGEVNQFRYVLTQAVANVIGSGLKLLGIATVEEM